MDGTFGRGGHTRAMLAAMSPSGSLHAFDMDPVLPTRFSSGGVSLVSCIATFVFSVFHTSDDPHHLCQEQCVTMHLYNHSHFWHSSLTWIFMLSNLTPGSHCSGQRTHAGAISLAES